MHSYVKSVCQEVTANFIEIGSYLIVIEQQIVDTFLTHSVLCT